MVEMNLDDSVIRQLGVEPNERTYVEFDAKGTLHVMERDDEGALIKDSPITEKSSPAASSDYQEILEEYENMQRKNKNSVTVFNSVLVGLVVALILTFVGIGVAGSIWGF